MELAQESIIIDEQSAFTYRLECDDFKGIIRLTNYKPTKMHKTRMTRRNIPIDTSTKWKFHYSRSGYYDRKSGDPFTGSYVSKAKHPYLYNKWLHFMYEQYKGLKERQEYLERR